MKLHALVGTQSEFDHSEKGDALYAFELALCAFASVCMGLRVGVKHVHVPRRERWGVYGAKLHVVLLQCQGCQKPTELVEDLGPKTHSF